MAKVSKTNPDKFITDTAIKCESHLDTGSIEAKSQGQLINDYPKTMSVNDKEYASRKHGFYQKRKTSDATCSQCLHSTTHAYKVTGAVTRKITKPCYSFQGNHSESKFDWTLKSNDRGLNYSSYLENSANFSEYQNFLPVRGSFQPFPKNCYVEEAGLRDNYPSRTQSKLKYERDTDKYNQAICAAGPDMAEGNVDWNNLFYSAILHFASKVMLRFCLGAHCTGSDTRTFKNKKCSILENMSRKE